MYIKRDEKEEELVKKKKEKEEIVSPAQGEGDKEKEKLVKEKIEGVSKRVVGVPPRAKLLTRVPSPVEEMKVEVQPSLQQEEPSQVEDMEVEVQPSLPQGVASPGEPREVISLRALKLFALFLSESKWSDLPSFSGEI